jgi:hypothetical protein
MQARLLVDIVERIALRTNLVYSPNSPVVDWYRIAIKPEYGSERLVLVIMIGDGINMGISERINNR